MSLSNDFVRTLQIVIKSTNTSSTLVGIIPKNARLLGKPKVTVVEAFDAGGTDVIDIGTSSDADYFCADVDVSSAGAATVSFNLYTEGDALSDSTGLYVKYTPSGSSPTAGEAHIVVQYILSEA
jgi:hypothetical protein